MIELDSYVIAWLIYLLSSVGALIVFWKMTRGLRMRRTRRVLRIFVAVVLLTPMNILANGLWLAPAFLVAAYALAQTQFEIAQQAMSVMSGAVAFMIVVVLLESVGRRLLGLQVGK